MLTFTIHIYHVLFFKNLTVDDYMHHIISVFFVGVISSVFPFGYCLGAVTFFICGLPGGLDYLLLALVKTNHVSSLTEKRLNRWLHQCIRAPGILLTTYCGLVSVIRGNGKMHVFWAILTFVLDNFNAMYYSNKVTCNYAVTDSKLSKHNQ